MICVTCETKTRVVMTRRTTGEIWTARFRACDGCNARFWTYELPEWDLKKMPPKGHEDPEMGRLEEV